MERKHFILWPQTKQVTAEQTGIRVTVVADFYLRSRRYAVYSLVEASLCLVVFGFVEPDLLLGQALDSTHDDAVIREDRKQ